MVSEESQYLVGFVARKDLAAAIDNSSRHIVDSNPDDASVFFTEVVPAIPSPSEGKRGHGQIEACSLCISTHITFLVAVVVLFPFPRPLSSLWRK